jgi:ABC-type oligopeptide transport system ATPase subunit
MQILTVSHLKKYFPVTKGLLRKQVGLVKAVDDVSFAINKGECIGIVGESGSGKTTLARILLRLIQPTSGTVDFEGQNIFSLNKQELMNFRRKAQIVFQDPHSSLNPRLTIEKTVGEGIIIHKLAKTKKERINIIAELLESVGLNPANMHRYPHEFSGGQRQRIGIARALSVNPELIIADEPVSSLDVSVQAQILNLFIDLQEKLNLTYIFIAHDLRVVEHISTRIIVMYMGKIVEIASKEELYRNPLHPYTKLLLNSIPNLDPEKRGFIDLNQNKLNSSYNREELILKETTPGHFVAS